jgi:hypothetical protein
MSGNNSKEKKDRLEKLQNGLADIDRRIKAHEAEIQKLIVYKNATAGAIEECQYWIDEESKKEEAKKTIKRGKK